MTEIELMVTLCELLFRSLASSMLLLPTVTLPNINDAGEKLRLGVLLSGIMLLAAVTEAGRVDVPKLCTFEAWD